MSGVASREPEKKSTSDFRCMVLTALVVFILALFVGYIVTPVSYNVSPAVEKFVDAHSRVSLDDLIELAKEHVRPPVRESRSEAATCTEFLMQYMLWKTPTAKIIAQAVIDGASVADAPLWLPIANPFKSAPADSAKQAYIASQVSLTLETLDALSKATTDGSKRRALLQHITAITVASDGYIRYATDGLPLIYEAVQYVYSECAKPEGFEQRYDDAVAAAVIRDHFPPSKLYKMQSIPFLTVKGRQTSSLCSSVSGAAEVWRVLVCLRFELAT
jgi:hypothetical protein